MIGKDIVDIGTPTGRCFCPKPVDNCEKCSRVDWSKVRPSNGDAARHILVAERISLSEEPAYGR
jgi:hypothetical protein